MRGVIWISILLTLLGALIIACDKDEEPLVMRNSLSQTVAVRIFGEWGGPHRIAKKGDSKWRDTVNLEPGEEASILIVGTSSGRRQYTIAIEDLDGEELFRRTFHYKELEQRKRRLKITEGGID